MLIRVKDRELYLAWIRYLTTYCGYKEDAVARTTAFFKTQRGEKPLYF